MRFGALFIVTFRFRASVSVYGYCVGAAFAGLAATADTSTANIAKPNRATALKYEPFKCLITFISLFPRFRLYRSPFRPKTVQWLESRFRFESPNIRLRTGWIGLSRSKNPPPLRRKRSSRL